MQNRTKVQFGIDYLLQEKLTSLRDLRVGLVTNSAAVTAAFPQPLTPSRLALQQAGVKLVKLFSPEHGINGQAAEGASVADQSDALTRLPVHSLYGVTQRPTSTMLADLDLLLFDIPDIGVRFYTYIWTLAHVLEACAENHLPLWVLDRPNPLSGDLRLVEGPLLDEARLSTFVGRWSIPVRHSLTIGELACWWNAERKLAVALTVLPVQNWQRNQSWPALALPFVPTSPNMPTYETALLYPGTCLFEGTNLSEGRGTTMPFRVVGAPWLDGLAVATAFNRLALPGVVAQAVYFTPASGKHAGQNCQGLMLHPLNPEIMRPLAMGLHLLTTIRQFHKENFQWAADSLFTPVSGYNHFDRLIGHPEIRQQLEDGAGDCTTLRQIDLIKAWTDAPHWVNCVTPHLLYR